MLSSLCETARRTIYSADDTIDEGFIQIWITQESFTAKNKSAKVVLRYTDRARTERHVRSGVRLRGEPGAVNE